MKLPKLLLIILLILITIGIILSSGLRAVLANNLWSIDFVRSYFNQPNSFPEIGEPPSSHAHAGVFYARYALGEGDLKSAQEYLKPGIKENDPLALDVYAEILYIQGEYEQAFNIWAKLENVDAIVEAMLEQRQKGNTDIELLARQSLYQIRPAKYTEGLALVLMQQDEFDHAISIINQSIEEYPYARYMDDWLAAKGRILRVKAEYFQTLGNWELAEASYQGALSVNPKDTNAWIGLGRLFYDWEQPFEKVVNCFNEVIAIDPMSGLAYYQVAEEYWHIGQNTLAYQFINEALRLMQTPTLEAYLLAGQIYEAEGVINQALFAYQQALSLDPDSSLAKQGVERLSESN